MGIDLELDSEYVISGICKHKGFCFKIDLCAQTVNVSDNSGSGKTYFLNLLRSALKFGISTNESDNGIIFSKGITEDILHIIENESVFEYLDPDKYVEHIFFIDRVDGFSKESVAKIQKLIDNNNTMILFHRYSKHLDYMNGVCTAKLITHKLNNDMWYFEFRT